jgi:phosphoketolase
MAAEPGPLTGSSPSTLDAYWRAANYLSVGQIYLMANPLLAEPLRAERPCGQRGVEQPQAARARAPLVI